MSEHYYNAKDLSKFGNVADFQKDMADKFFSYYGEVFKDSELTAREKSLIALAVSHAVQCPYCIDAYTQSSLENGSNMEQMTEAIHLASAIRGGASLIHGIQSHNAHDKVSM